MTLQFTPTSSTATRQAHPYRCHRISTGSLSTRKKREQSGNTLLIVLNSTSRPGSAGRRAIDDEYCVWVTDGWMCGKSHASERARCAGEAQSWQVSSSATVAAASDAFRAGNRVEPRCLHLVAGGSLVRGNFTTPFFGECFLGI
jgi:hypothetical protein